MLCRLLNTIQINCPHILRYLTAAAILHKRRKNVIKDLIRVLLQSTHDVLPPLPASALAGAQPAALTSSPTSLSYNDPLISFLLSLYTDFDFAVSHAHLQQCRTLLAKDFFLAGPMERELIETLRVLLFEAYTAIHSRVAIDKMAGEVDLSREVRTDKDGEIVVESEEEERRRQEDESKGGEAGGSQEEKTGGGGGAATDDAILVSLLRACHVNGRIDSFNGHLLMLGDVPSVYQQVIDRTRSAAYRATQMAQNISKRVKAKKEQAGQAGLTED